MVFGKASEDSGKGEPHGRGVAFERSRRTVIDGPSAETRELVAGFLGGPDMGGALSRPVAPQPRTS